MHIHRDHTSRDYAIQKTRRQIFPIEHRTAPKRAPKHSQRRKAEYYFIFFFPFDSPTAGSSESGSLELVQLVAELFLLGAARLAELPALDVRAEEALDVDFAIEEVLGYGLGGFLARVGGLAQEVPDVFGGEDGRELGVTVGQGVVTGAEGLDLLDLGCHVVAELLQLLLPR